MSIAVGVARQAEASSVPTVQLKIETRQYTPCSTLATGNLGTAEPLSDRAARLASILLCRRRRRLGCALSHGGNLRHEPANVVQLE